ncbi:MAG: hypothetical protein HQK61_11105 [Desulfamplus sp.]|nr:hypothetical protein [Desulfamplus sp.]
MSKTLFLIFSHDITAEQKLDAQNTLGISRFVGLTPELKDLWGQIPADIESVGDYIFPVWDWLSVNSDRGDYVLVQGDFGAVYHLVNLASDLGIIPVYSTTERNAVEVRGSDGTVRLTHTFRHVRFRKYA